MIYKFFYDFSESFCEGLEQTINDIIANNIEKAEIEKLIKNSFDIIFNEFREKIYKNSNNGKIYNDDENNGDNNDYDYNKNMELSNRKKEIDNDDMDCAYPSFK